MSGPILHTGQVRIPKIGFGTYALSGKTCIEAVTDAVNVGYRHFDTAQFYANEHEVGKGIRESGIKRNEVFITTKIWPTRFNQVEKAAEESLAALGTDYVDLLLLHWPSSDRANRTATDALAKVRERGLTRHIGVSNFSIQQLEQALTQAPVCCNQVEYHPFMEQKNMLEFIRKHGLFLTAYSPLALGKASYNKTLERIGQRYQKSASQVALRWLVQQEAVAAIPKAATHEKREENLNIFDFELTAEEMALAGKIETLSY